MELIFLSERNLAVLDYAHVSDDFEIILDALVPQKSKFTVNKQSLKAGAGDYLVIKDRNYFYVGIINSIEDEDNGTLKVTAKDFLSKFDVKVPVSSFSGNISNFLLNLINSNFISSGDSRQNLPYLITEVEASKTGSVTYDADATENIIDLNEEFSKTYGIRLAYEVIVQNGVFYKIKVKVVSVKKGAKIKSTLGTISNLVIKDSNNDSLNKVIYVPKSDNTSHRNTINYFLLSDGTISTTVSSAKRIIPVSFKYQSYSDKDYDSLLTKATKDLIDSSLEHSISFDFAISINKVKALDDLSVGDFIEFVTPTKTYETLITKISYKGTFNIVNVTLGEKRISLTDKLKLLDRRK